MVRVRALVLASQVGPPAASTAMAAMLAAVAGTG
jgi:hypothetical protein